MLFEDNRPLQRELADSDMPGRVLARQSGMQSVREGISTWPPLLLASRLSSSAWLGISDLRH